MIFKWIKSIFHKHDYYQIFIQEYEKPLSWVETVFFSAFASEHQIVSPKGSKYLYIEYCHECRSAGYGISTLRGFAVIEPDYLKAIFYQKLDVLASKLLMTM